MENTSSPFIIMIQAFFVQCYTCYRQYIHKCAIFQNIVFILRTHIYIVTNIFYFSHKNSVHTVHPNQHKAAPTVVYIKHNRRIYCSLYSYKKKLRCILSSVFVWPQHLIHITCNVFPGLAANPSMKSINCYISTCVFHSLEKGYTHLWILVIHFHLQSKKNPQLC